MTNSNQEKLQISRKNDKSYPDKASIGAYSRWLEDDGRRLRIVTYPSGYEADHVCYDGHSFYVINGSVKIELGSEVTEWHADDAFIIPNNIPHCLFNITNEDAIVVVMDNG